MIGLLTPTTLASLLQLLGRVSHLEGAIGELGVYQGSTLKKMAETVPAKTCYGFDTFYGQPEESWRQSDFHRPGEFGDTSFEEVMKAMPSNVVLVQGLFPESASEIDERFCFIHLDFDLGKSTEDAIEWLKPRMVSGGIIVFDDWGWKHCPGVAKAITRAALPVARSEVHQCYWIAP